ncbi:hypothetical protein [Algiphilus aromaticivorans]|uniref:hypothetical protein n=1 Tax=Algiphilus aromaticivorans TaxID=382454 RepID=UPI0005C25F0A|nr:hypothetical protein [Algiphilus aromaticivorans]
MTTVDVSRFRRLLLFRRRGHPLQILRVLEDFDGWYYVVNLAGTPDFGPYLHAEIVDAFDVEQAPCATRDLTPTVGGNAAPSD